MTWELFTYYVFQLIIPAVEKTLIILVIVTILASVISFALAMVLYLTSPRGLYPKSGCYFIANAGVNFLRAIPVIVFIVMLMPAARVITGSGIGIPAGIICLLFVVPPYTTRVFEKNLNDVNMDLIVAGYAMGLSKKQILFHIIIHNALPSIVLSVVFVAFVTLSATAMLGVVGVSGIGNVALTYGYQTFNRFVMWGCIIIIILFILIIYGIGNWIYRKIR